MWSVCTGASLHAAAASRACTPGLAAFRTQPFGVSLLPAHPASSCCLAFPARPLQCPPQVLFSWLPGMVCLLLFTLSLVGAIGDTVPEKFSNDDYTPEELAGFEAGTLEFYPNCRWVASEQSIKGALASQF